MSPMDEMERINRLAIVTTKGNAIERLTQQLSENGFYFTLLDTSSGGLLEGPTTSLMIGIPEARHEQLLKLVRVCCYTHRKYIPARMDNPELFVQPRLIEAEAGGALIYTLKVERFERF